MFLVVSERQDFRGKLPEQTEGSAVTKYGVLVRTNTINRGIKAEATQPTHRGTEAEATAEFPKANVFDTELKPTNERMRTTTSLFTTLQSMEHLLSGKEQSS